MFALDFYDAVLVSGQVQIQETRELERLRHLKPKELVTVGMPFMDEMWKRYKNHPQSPHSGVTVLLAPSWGPSSILNRFGEVFIRKLLATGFHVIIRPHPQSYVSEKDLLQKLSNEFPENEQVEWNHDADNFDVLSRSDILISDFSGVMLDFALVYDKPIIYTDTQFDDSIYDACWLKEPAWIFSILPDIGLKLDDSNIDSIKDLIQTCLTDEKFAKGRAKAVSEIWEHRGEGAKRAADYLISKYNELTVAKEKDA